MNNNEYKNCPYCHEEIKVQAIKCKHCESLLYEIEHDVKEIDIIKISTKKTTGTRPFEKYQFDFKRNKTFSLIIAVIAGFILLIYGVLSFFYDWLDNDDNELLVSNEALEVDELEVALEEEYEEVEIDNKETEEVLEPPDAVDEKEIEPDEEVSDVISAKQEPVKRTETQGTISWDGGTYTGPLSNGVPNGWGTWNGADGKSYIGSFLNGRMTGQGTMVFPNGIVYIGEFLNGKGHGQGKMTHPDGRSISGTWIDGVYLEDELE